MKPKNPQTDSTRILFEGRKYCGIQEIGFSILEGKTDEHFTVCLHNSPVSPIYSMRGGYFTCIPISPWSYRKDHPTRAAFKRTSTNQIIIFSDHGSPTTINTKKAIIDELVAECRLYNIPENTEI